MSRPVANRPTSIRFATLILLFPLWMSTPAQAKAPISVAVFEFTGKGGLGPQELQVISALVADEINKFRGYRAVSSDDISSMLDEDATRQLKGCSDDKCLAEIGTALSVEQLLVGKINAFGQSFLMTVRLLDVRKVEIIDVLSLRLRGDTADLLAEIPNSIRELFGQQVILPERYEVQLHFQFGDALLADAEASDPWWSSNGYDRPDVWGDDWVELGGEHDSRGLGTGKGWLLGARFGLRVGKLHTVFAQADYGQEHWRGKTQPDGNNRWRLNMDLHALRLTAGYRFAYPLLDWLWPFAELGLGIHMLFGQNMSSPEDDALGKLAPEPRILFSLNPGVRFQLPGRIFTSVSWLFDLPLGESTLSGPMLAAGFFF